MPCPLSQILFDCLAIKFQVDDIQMKRGIYACSRLDYQRFLECFRLMLEISMEIPCHMRFTFMHNYNPALRLQLESLLLLLLLKQILYYKVRTMKYVAFFIYPFTNWNFNITKQSLGRCTLQNDFIEAKAEIIFEKQLVKSTLGFVYIISYELRFFFYSLY